MTFPVSKLQASVLIYPLLIFFYLVIVFFSAFYSQGPLLQTDQPLWATVAYLMRTEVFADQGWFWNVIFDQGGAGQNIGKNYSIPLILPWLFTFFFSAATAVKLAVFVSTLLFLLAFYYVARLFVPGCYALLCSLVILTPMFDNIVSGMWYNYFALGCGLSFWLCCHYFFNTKSLAALICGTFSFALAIYSHPVGVILCVAILLAYLIIVVVLEESHKLVLISCFLSMFCSGILLAFPQVLAVFGLDSGPYLPSSGQTFHRPLEISGVLETFRRLFVVRLWGAVTEPQMHFFLILINMIGVWILVVLGISSLRVSKNLERIAPFFSLFIITAILISRIYNFLDFDIGVLRSLSFFYDRLQLLSQVYLILLAAMGLHFLTRYISKNFFLKLIYGILVANLVCITLRTPKKIYWDHTHQLATLETSILAVDVNNLWQWLAQNIHKDDERVYFEDTYGKLHWNNSSNPEAFRTHLLALTSVNTDVRQIGGWCGFSSNFGRTYEQGTIFGKSIHAASFTDQFILSRMELLNCRYIVVYSDIVVERLRRVPSLEEKRRFGVFYIFKYHGMNPRWAYNTVTGEKAEYVRHSSSHFEVIADGKKDERVFISMAYHPNYWAEYKDRKIPIINDRLLMSIRLPVDGQQSINFYYVFRKKIAFYAIGLGLFLFALPKFLIFKVTDE